MTDLIKRAVGGTYPSVAAFLADKASFGSAEAGDWFIHTGLGAPLFYDSVGAEWQCLDPNAKYTYVDFTRSCSIFGNLNSGAAVSGADAAINSFMANGKMFERYVDTPSTTATVINPVLLLAGLELSSDDADNEGSELTTGVTAFGKSAFKVGTSPAFTMKAKINIPVVAAFDVIQVGFRKAAATTTVPSDAATLTAYEDVASFNVDNGNVKLSTRLAAGTGESTDTGYDMANTDTSTFEVNVSQSGVASFKYNGKTVSPTTALTLTSGVYVIPFIHVYRDAATALEPVLVSWKCGLQ